MSQAIKSVAEVLTQAEYDALESLIDRRTLGSVLSALHDICLEKCAHIESVWQDDRLAKSWERDSKACGKLSIKVEN